MMPILKQYMALIIMLMMSPLMPSPVMAEHDEMKHMKHMKKMMMKENMTIIHLFRDDPDAAGIAMSLASQLREKTKKVLLLLDVKGVKLGGESFSCFSRGQHQSSD